jgi:hypothetical protein
VVTESAMAGHNVVIPRVFIQPDLSAPAISNDPERRSPFLHAAP